MIWDDESKKRLQGIISKKLDEICVPVFSSAPSLEEIAKKHPEATIDDIARLLAPNYEERDVRFAQFFAELGIEHKDPYKSEWIVEKEGFVALDTVGLRGGLKGPFINVPEEVAERILLEGLP